MSDYVEMYNAEKEPRDLFNIFKKEQVKDIQGQINKIQHLVSDRLSQLGWKKYVAYLPLTETSIRDFSTQYALV